MAASQSGGLIESFLCFLYDIVMISMDTRKDEFDWQRVQSVEDLELGREYLFRPEFVPLLYSYLGIRPGLAVADIGCGTGSFSRLLAQGLKGKGRVIGVDPDQTLLRLARNRAEQEGLSGLLEFKYGDAYSLPFGDETFDVTTSHTLLGILRDPMKCIIEKRRVTKQGGIVSAVETIGTPGKMSYPGDYTDLEMGRLTELEEKTERVWREAVYPFLKDTLGIWSDVPPSSYPILFRNAGLNDIEVNGYLSLFTISDRRYSIQEMKEYLRRDFEDRVKKIRKSFSEHKVKYKGEGVTEADIEELATLWKRKYEYLVDTPKRIRKVFEMEARTRIIIAGTRRG